MFLQEGFSALRSKLKEVVKQQIAHSQETQVYH